MIDPDTASADIDLAAFRANVATVRALVAPAETMVVVKADGYGHGMIACAREARVAGATWIGAATPAEALVLRAAGDRGRLLVWLYGPNDDLSALVADEVDVSAQSLDQLARLTAATAATGRVARVHLKIDTGLARNGAAAADWAELCRAAAAAERAGAVEIVAVWSHLAAADEPGHPSIAAQLAAFDHAYGAAVAAGLQPIRHLANSAGALVLPQARFDLVRLGIAAYGIDPAPGIAASAGVALHPVMRLRARLANVKPLGAGSAVSYGWTWTADRPTTVGLVPLGYADGIPRHASNRAEIATAAGRVPVRGRICMDQFVVDLGAASTATVGTEVTLFGSGADGEPTAEEWAGWCDTIGYEIVTRIGVRVPRRHLGASA